MKKKDINSIIKKQGKITRKGSRQYIKLLEEEKNKRRDYSKSWYRIMSEEYKQKLKEYKKQYRQSMSQENKHKNK